jgi:hypothetical protein
MGLSINQIATILGTSYYQIRDIIRGRSWKDAGCQYGLQGRVLKGKMG